MCNTAVAEWEKERWVPCLNRRCLALLLLLLQTAMPEPPPGGGLPKHLARHVDESYWHDLPLDYKLSCNDGQCFLLA